MLQNLLFIALILCFLSSQAQNITITPPGITPASQYPRLNYDALLALPNPIEGDIAYDLTFKCLRVYNGIKWVCSSTSVADTTPDMAAVLTLGSDHVESAGAIAVDTSGNFYVTGVFVGIVSFGTTTLTAMPGADLFIAKYNGSGVLQWARSAGGNTTVYGNDIAVDKHGNSYIVGYFEHTVRFEDVTLTSQGSLDMFVAKYDNNGIFQWVRSAGGTGSDTGRGIAVDNDDNVYITGSFNGTGVFGTSSIISSGSDDICFAKYAADGNLQWVRSAGGVNREAAADITVDADKNIYIAAGYEISTAFGAVTLTSAGGLDIVVAKYNSEGLLQWVKSAGGSQSEQVGGITVDLNGNLYMTGRYQSTSAFGTVTVTSLGGSDIFVAKYTPNGTVQWVRSAGSPVYDKGFEIATDALGNVYVTGESQGNVSFGTVSTPYSGLIDMFIAKYSTNGDFKWVRSAGGEGYDNGKDIAVDSKGNIYVTGGYEYTITLGNTIKNAAGEADVFVVRLSQ